MKMSVWVAVVCPGSRRVLLARRAAHASNGNKWNFFGGGVDHGENPMATAIRELSEESGLSARHTELIPLGEVRAPGKLNVLYGLTVQTEVKPTLNTESSAWAWVPMLGLDARKDLHPSTVLLLPRLFEWMSIKVPI